MNKEYWKDFYKKHTFKIPSTFVQFAIRYIPSNSTILDIGCGDGRDAYYLAENGHNVTGIDYANQPKEAKNIKFKKMNLDDAYNDFKKYDVVYSRFFVHAISESKIHDLLHFSKNNIFISEFRVKGDKPKLYTNHKRTLVEGNNILKELIDKKHDIIYYKKGYDMARYRDENPYIVRIITNKKH